MDKNMVFHETDILVAGGSGAGIFAAVAAVEAKCRVLVASRGKVGKSGNAIMAGGSFSIDGVSAKKFGYEKANEKVTQDVVFDNLVKEGYFLNDQNIVRQFVEESPEVVHRLVKYGEKAGQKFDFLPPAKWFSVGRAWGTAIKQAALEHPDIRIMEDVMIVDLVKNEGRVCGAVGYDIYGGRPVFIKAKAVVIATGGFQPYTLKTTVTDMTGDGIAMAFRAGASIADMEFLLCFPTALSPKRIRGSIYPYLFESLLGKWGVLPLVRDGRGDLIEVPEDLAALVKGSKMMKLVSHYFWGHRIYRGRGSKNGGVFLDYSNVPYEVKEANLEKYKNYMSSWHRKGYYMGDDISSIYDKVLNNGPIEVGLGYEYSNGGIVIDEHMETGVPGLYAAGEAGSGTFGAMRAGDGLTEMVVQGYRAGKSASSFVRESYDAPLPDHLPPEEVNKVFSPLETRGDGLSPIKIREIMEAAADEGFGFIRDEDGLTRCLNTIERIEKDIFPDMKISDRSTVYNLELIHCHAVRNLLLCMKAGVRAAILRKESRGCHIRADYPEVNHDDFLKRIIFRMEDDSMVHTMRAPVAEKFPLPKGRDENIMAYLFNEDHKYLRPKMR